MTAPSDKPGTAQCMETITLRGQYYVAGYSPSIGVIVRDRRSQCGRKAGPGGYCWQHQPARDKWNAERATDKRRTKHG